MSRDVSGGAHGRLPLRYRRLNPPFPFVGREVELARLTALVEDSRVALVHGPSGWGKTSLVSAHLASTDPDASRCTVRLDARAPSDVDLVTRALRVLASALGVAPSELPRPSTDEDRIGQLIDIADRARAIVVIDDLGNDVASEVDVAARVLIAASQYGRRAQWIATSRTPLPGLAPAHVVSLAPLTIEALSLLAISVQPLCADAAMEGLVARMARQASGSPARLLSSLSDASSAPDASDIEGSEALALLRTLRLPVPRSSLIGAITAEELDLLVARGHVLGLPHGVRAQPTDAVTLPPPAALLRLAAALSRHPSAEASLEAVRLRLACGEVEAASTILEERGAGLLAEGYGSELWSVLASHPAPALASWQLSAAAEDGRPLALARAVDPGASASPRARLGWLKVRYAREDHLAVASDAFDVASAAERAALPEVACEARLMGASSLMSRGDYEAAEREVTRAVAPTLASELQVQVVLAMVAARKGDAARARALADVAFARLDEVSGRARANLTYNLALVLYGLGEPQRAAQLFERMFPVDALATAALVGRRVLEMDAHLSVLGGQLVRAESLLARLAKFVVPGTPIEARRTLISSTLELLMGRLHTAGDGARRGAELASIYAGDEDRAYALTLAAQAAWRSGIAPPDARDAASLHGVSGRLAETWLALSQLALDGRAEPAPDASAEGYDELSVALLALAQARALFSGEAPDLRTLFTRAAKLASLPARGWLLLFGMQLGVAAGQTLPDEVREALPAIGASEIDREATLHAACAEALPDLEALARLASDGSSAGITRAVAAALLGGPLPSTELASRMASALRGRLGWSQPLDVPLASAGSAPTEAPVDVYFDAPRMRLKVGHGTVELESHPVLVRLLASLVVHGGAADKETLVTAVWGIRDYHPLHHDNRLRLAVRKLRALVAPSAIVKTREDGYVLEGRMRWLGDAPKERILDT